ncbi:glycosyltransferase [Microbacterium sp. NPDC019599]|uniref:glycosyltransferase n=1 Tax=Microbacterium sp. NPDC019599 TaxID=3154690 RepID=UPI0033EED37E
MRALILTFGTRGDIEPFAALADRLAVEGHEVALAAPESHRHAVSAAVLYEPMGTEMDRVMREAMADMNGPAEALTAGRQMMAAMRVSLDEQWEIAQRFEPTVVVAHPKALGGPHIGGRLGVPVVPSLPLPFLTPTAAFPVPFTARPLGPRLNRLSYTFNRFTALAYGGMINRFRRDQLGLERASRFSDYLHSADGERMPVLYSFSRHVVPRPPDYPASAHVTGYWFREPSSTEWAPPPELSEFLEGDGPVVYIGFGSMGFGKDAERRGRVVAEAVHAAGTRAVVAQGWGALQIQPTRDVLLIDEVPHEWLFPRVAAVVHHGGAGTTAAGLRAGKPTMICPVLGDQPFWGRRVHELGVGPAPVPLRRLSSEELASAITGMLHDDAYRARAADIAAQLAQEDGTGQAVRVLEGLDARVAGRG